MNQDIETKSPVIYESVALEKEVKMWVNMNKIRKQDVSLENAQFKQKLKIFTKKLQDKNIPVKKYDFNNDSVLYYIRKILP